MDHELEDADRMLARAKDSMTGLVPGAHQRYPEAMALVAIGTYLRRILDKLNEPPVL